MMDWLLHVAARALIGGLQALPLSWAARVGRAGGALAWWLDARHRQVTLDNLRRCFRDQQSDAQLRALARENFRRIGENFACAAKTAAMSAAALRPHLRLVNLERIAPSPDRPVRNTVVAIGHFGNFELYARVGQFVSGYQPATTYRRLRQPALDRLLQSLRARSGCLFFERVTEGAALRAALRRGNLLLGLLADQRAGGSGLQLPFLGHTCSTSPAPAVLALRYDCRLFTAICYRVGLARWDIECGEEIPTHVAGRPRPVADIMRDVNHALETAVRRDPANWFWVHNRWKPPRRQSRKDPTAPDAEAGRPRPQPLGMGAPASAPACGGRGAEAAQDDGVPAHEPGTRGPEEVREEGDGQPTEAPADGVPAPHGTHGDARPAD